MLVLVDTGAATAYWQRVTPSTVSSSGKRFKVHVPEDQSVSTAAGEWAFVAKGLESKAEERYELNLGYIPPATRSLIEKLAELSHADAALLAMHLAEGRASPIATASSLLTASPDWLTRLGDVGWRAVAAYASDHGALQESVEAFLRAAELAPATESAKLRAAAGINLVTIDPDKARHLFDQASVEEDVHLVVAVGRLLLERMPGDASPLQLPTILADGGPEVEASELGQRILADDAFRKRDWNTAAIHAERALGISPTNTDCMAQLARIYGARSGSVDRQANDLRESADLYGRAIQQRRQWAGGGIPELLLDLTRSLGLQGRFDTILTWLLPDPFGTATLDEAAHPEILRQALQAAAFTRRGETVRAVAEKMGRTNLDKIALDRAGVARLERSQAEKAWRKEFSRAHREHDYEAVAKAAVSLANLGINVAGQLDEYVNANIIPAATQLLVAALVQVQKDFSSGIVSLRRLARSDLSAADFLVQSLKTTGLNDDAIRACRLAYDRFRIPDFLVALADLLIQAELFDEAEKVVNQVLLLTDGLIEDRERLASFLAHRAARRGEWTEAEAVLTRILAEPGTRNPLTLWNLVRAKLAAGKGISAAQTVRAQRPQIQNPEQAKLWFQAMIHLEWNESIVSEALALAVRFEADTQLSVAILGHIISATSSHTIESENPLTAADVGLQFNASSTLHRQALSALDDLVTKHGSSAGVTILNGSPEELLEQMRPMLEADQDPSIHELYENVCRAVVPIGLLAARRRKSYANLLIERAAGLIVGVAADDSEHELEQAAALKSFGGSVVVDASSLLISSQISASVDGLFDSLLLSPESRRDIARAMVEIRTLKNSPGSLSWDPRTQAPLFIERTPSDYAWMLSRAEIMESEAARCTILGVPAGLMFEDLDDEIRSAPWLTPIELARHCNTSLWTDDLAQRRLARSFGIEAFGTLAIVDCLSEDRLASDQPADEVIKQLEKTIRELLAEGVVDVPAHLADVISQAEADNWLPLQGALVISRPAWWAGQVSPLDDLRDLYNSIGVSRADLLPHWQYAAMLGLGRGQVDSDAQSRVLALLALMGFADEALAAELVDGFSRAREAATYLGCPDPAAQLPLAAQILRRAGMQRSQDVVDELIRGLA